MERMTMADSNERRQASDKRIALVLQGGGALGSYQAGVYEALAEAGYLPDWMAGISIGAVNAALIAGNAPEHRVAALRAFWEEVSAPTALWPDLPLPGWGAALRQGAALSAMAFGQPGFFRPVRFSMGTTSYYDTSALRATLERLCDFGRINAGATRLSVGAVNVRTGNFAYFDTAHQALGPEHVMASGALPPGFPPIEIDGEQYWDGGLVSNTPLQYVLDDRPRRETLAFQVDLFSARGRLPENLDDVEERRKDIQYSSRTRQATDLSLEIQKLRRTVRSLLQKLPEGLDNDPDVVAAREDSCSKVHNVIHLIYRDKAFEAYHKDYEFSRLTMREHWESGLDDIRRTLAYPEWLERPDNDSGVVTHDVHRLHVKT
jgi:NTE family protein